MWGAIDWDRVPVVLLCCIGAAPTPPAVQQHSSHMDRSPEPPRSRQVNSSEWQALLVVFFLLLLFELVLPSNTLQFASPTVIAAARND